MNCANKLSKKICQKGLFSWKIRFIITCIQYKPPSDFLPAIREGKVIVRIYRMHLPLLQMTAGDGYRHSLFITKSLLDKLFSIKHEKVNNVNKIINNVLGSVSNNWNQTQNPSEFKSCHFLYISTLFCFCTDVKN